MTHLDLRAAMAKQVQQLRFVEFEVWFPPRRDERASEGFYTPLQEDFYNAYLNSRAVFRSQRVCHIDSIVAAAGEHICPYLISIGAIRFDWTNWTICSILGLAVLCFPLDRPTA